MNPESTLRQLFYSILASATTADSCKEVELIIEEQIRCNVVHNYEDDGDAASHLSWNGDF